MAVAVAVALLCLGIAAASLVLGDRQQERDDDLRAGALAAARDRTTVLTTYDHRSLDEDFAAVLETATGDFAAEYRRTTEQLRPAFLESKAVADGKVVAAGLEGLELDADPVRAVAVVAVDQVITTAGARPRTERNRLRMELVRPDGTWLVRKVERL